MSSNDISSGLVRHNREQQRFELETSGGLAVAEYHREGDTLIVFFTEVPRTLHGRGIGKKLVRGLLDEARQSNLKIVPRCSFVAALIQSHPEYRDLLA